ncbi:DsbA family protein [Teichococcus oryzae]|uniref:Thioredoxin domain-containing protein n=1 Tax=Teichococcus oryzae TaxID=1608942 RepID=A0A5B2TFI6_9PROT|nr:thioredoxin domain-containing protein [Pseudoroseomonas oryzae]KAA2213262.1 thioredoxin domain-containing protein [Pseudoroseomonas oryzae]
MPQPPRSPGRPLGRSPGRSPGRSLGRSLGRSTNSPLDVALGRRGLLLAPALLPLAAQAQPASPPEGPPLPPRGAGRADAPMVVTEYFSLTCNHCAHFHLNTWPRLQRELVDSGEVRMVWRDFPLDELALEAAQIARALPEEAYEPFIRALFASQERWAFDRDTDKFDELAKLAALAGMQRWQVEAALDNDDLRRAVLRSRLEGERDLGVTKTPTFFFNGRKAAGALSFERFVSFARG